MAPYRVSSVEASSMALYRVSSAAPWRAIATQPPEARRRGRLLEVGLLAGLSRHGARSPRCTESAAKGRAGGRIKGGTSHLCLLASDVKILASSEERDS